MKTKLILAILLLMLFVKGFAQEVMSIVSIRPELTERPWIDHSTHHLNGFTIKMVFGETPTKYRHSNLGQITTVEYLDQGQLLDSLDRSDLDTHQKTELRKKFLEAKGGAVNLFISRAKESDANFKWFFIVIRGEDDRKKIMEIDLEYQAAKIPEGNGWWNYTTVLLPMAVKTPFYIYVNDRQSKSLSDFKFLIDR